MAVKGWISGDESAKEMLARVMTERPFLLLPPLHRLPLRVGNVVEIVGPSPSAKTDILIQASVNCILPKEWNGVHYGGLECLVFYIDLDCNFDILRLSQSLKHRIMEANGAYSEIYGDKNNDVWNYETKEESCVIYNEELFAACMRRFLYMRCYDSFEFLSTLKTLHYQLRKEREEQGVSIYFLMIDSIGAFYWVDRASTSLLMGASNRKRLSLQSVSETVVQEIRKLLLVHPMLILTTKATILGIGQQMGSADFGATTGIPQKLSYREYMPSVWQSFVTHRILIRVSEDDLTKNKHQNCSVYSVEWLLPPLSLMDKFIVRDAGIFVS
ncbi:DNA repair protein XRCC2 homolog isoform X2 [Malania oleifera]|uniref:DNA repair protein XRCC2 homolog isoform X2 n=1 Tax=Malania oleifera TaxID=397392 RepID=UPI0025ADE7D3|nr:DNA repair protein XRCC2 homolog isoform X2 [Malania oleifera]